MNRSEMTRRAFTRTIASTVVASTALRSAFAGDRTAAGPLGLPESETPSTRPLRVGMLLFPELTAMDLVGPQTVLSTHAEIHLIWKNKDLIRSDRGMGMLPDTTLEECPRDLDVLFVPGGRGMLAVMRDRELLDFLADRGGRARYVTSVCTGALVLGAAGLLEGYRATTHWAARDVLRVFGAEPVAERVVIDRNRVTGGGVTAGLDFGFVLLAALRSERDARVTQLAMEYDPQPPFDSGSPEAAGPEITRLALATLADLQKETQTTISELMAARQRPS